MPEMVRAFEPRKVRCPNCKSLLIEPPGISVYKCPICANLLQAKKTASSRAGGPHVDRIFADQRARESSTSLVGIDHSSQPNFISGSSDRTPDLSEDCPTNLATDDQPLYRRPSNRPHRRRIAPRLSADRNGSNSESKVQGIRQFGREPDLDCISENGSVVELCFPQNAAGTGLPNMLRAVNDDNQTDSSKEGCADAVEEVVFVKPEQLTTTDPLASKSDLAGASGRISPQFSEERGITEMDDSSEAKEKVHEYSVVVVEDTNQQHTDFKPSTPVDWEDSRNILEETVPQPSNDEQSVDVVEETNQQLTKFKPSSPKDCEAVDVLEEIILQPFNYGQSVDVVEETRQQLTDFKASSSKDCEGGVDVLEETIQQPNVVEETSQPLTADVLEETIQQPTTDKHSADVVEETSQQLTYLKSSSAKNCEGSAGILEEIIEQRTNYEQSADVEEETGQQLADFKPSSSTDYEDSVNVFEETIQQPSNCEQSADVVEETSQQLIDFKPSSPKDCEFSVDILQETIQQSTNYEQSADVVEETSQQLTDFMPSLSKDCEDSADVLEATIQQATNYEQSVNVIEEASQRLSVDVLEKTIQQPTNDEQAADVLEVTIQQLNDLKPSSPIKGCEDSTDVLEETIQQSTDDEQSTDVLEETIQRLADFKPSSSIKGCEDSVDVLEETIQRPANDEHSSDVVEETSQQLTVFKASSPKDCEHSENIVEETSNLHINYEHSVEVEEETSQQCIDFRLPSPMDCEHSVSAEVEEGTSRRHIDLSPAPMDCEHSADVVLETSQQYSNHQTGIIQDHQEAASVLAAYSYESQQRPDFKLSSPKDCDQTRIIEDHQEAAYVLAAHSYECHELNPQAHTVEALCGGQATSSDYYEGCTTGAEGVTEAAGSLDSSLGSQANRSQVCLKGRDSKVKDLVENSRLNTEGTGSVDQLANGGQGLHASLKVCVVDSIPLTDCHSSCPESPIVQYISREPKLQDDECVWHQASPQPKDSMVTSMGYLHIESGMEDERARLPFDTSAEVSKFVKGSKEATGFTYQHPKMDAELYDEADGQLNLRRQDLLAKEAETRQLHTNGNFHEHVLSRKSSPSHDARAILDARHHHIGKDARHLVPGTYFDQHQGNGTPFIGIPAAQHLPTDQRESQFSLNEQRGYYLSDEQKFQGRQTFQRHIEDPDRNSLANQIMNTGKEESCAKFPVPDVTELVQKHDQFSDLHFSGGPASMHVQQRVQNSTSQGREPASNQQLRDNASYSPQEHSFGYPKHRFQQSLRQIRQPSQDSIATSHGSSLPAATQPFPLQTSPQTTTMPPSAYEHPFACCFHHSVYPVCEICVHHFHLQHHPMLHGILPQHCAFCFPQSVYPAAIPGSLLYPHWPPFIGSHIEPPHSYSQLTPYQTGAPQQMVRSQGSDFSDKSEDYPPKKQKCYPPLPREGAAPYVLCRHCNQLLQVPAYLPPNSGSIQKLRCGACMEVSKFSIRQTELANTGQNSLGKEFRPLTVDPLVARAHSASSSVCFAAEENVEMDPRNAQLLGYHLSSVYDRHLKGSTVPKSQVKMSSVQEYSKDKLENNNGSYLPSRPWQQDNGWPLETYATGSTIPLVQSLDSTRPGKYPATFQGVGNSTRQPTWRERHVLVKNRSLNIESHSVFSPSKAGESSPVKHIPQMFATGNKNSADFRDVGLGGRRQVKGGSSESSSLIKDGLGSLQSRCSDSDFDGQASHLETGCPLPPPVAVPGSPLHEHFGYTSPEELLGRQELHGPWNGAHEQMKESGNLSSSRGSNGGSAARSPVLGSPPYGTFSYGSADFGQRTQQGDYPQDHGSNIQPAQWPPSAKFDESLHKKETAQGFIEGREETGKDAGKGNNSFAGFLKRSLKEFSKGNQGNSYFRRKVIINEHLVPDAIVKKVEEYAGSIHPGSYWYDNQAGFWGVMGGPCLGIIRPFIEELNYPMSRDCAGGSTGVLVNGRELHQKDLEILARRGLPTTPGKSYSIEINGTVVDRDSGKQLGNLGKLFPKVEKKGRENGRRPTPSMKPGSGIRT